jgi:hypothetical protein
LRLKVDPKRFIRELEVRGADKKSLLPDVIMTPTISTRLAVL